jgi:hypothetical protein
VRTKSAIARVTWAQVHAFRVARHGLERRAAKRALVKTLGAMGGAQAQVMSAAEMQIAVRVDCSASDVRNALWRDRTLVKTWLMRGTLHLVPAADLPLYTAGLRTRWTRPRNSWLKYFGMSESDLDEFVETVGGALSDTPLTKDELIAVAGRGRSPRVREWLRSGWGGLLKPAARRGLLCFGPSRGTSVTFVRPAKWLPIWRELDPDAALVELARRYLRAYGPATKYDFAAWFGHWAGIANAAWSGLGGELARVSIDGVAADILARDLDALLELKASRSVRLLPPFDPYLMGYAARDHLFDRVHAPRVSRTAGWISAVVLAGGRVEGTWTHAIASDTLRIAIAPFGRLSPRVRSETQDRAGELARAMGLAKAEVRVVSR